MNSGVSVPGPLAELLHLSGADRPHSLSLPAIAPLDSAWVVASWHGHEALGPHGLAADAALVTQQWWVDLVSTDDALPLDAMLGQPATLWTRTATGERVARTGLVASAEQLGRDQAFTRYRLQLVPWTWLLAQGRHSRVFQDRSVLQIVETVLTDYAPHAVWQVADDVGPFLGAVPPRSYCVQYRETDAAFLGRLLAEEGLGLRMEACADASAGHRLVVFADSAQLPQELSAAIRGGIRFHRSDATEQADAVQAFGALRALGATSLTLLSHDYKTVAATTANVALGAGVGSGTGQRADGSSGYAAAGTDDRGASSDALALELYDPVGAYAFADRVAAQRVAELLAEAHDVHRQRWLGRGTVRSFAAGRWFALLGAPADRSAVPDEVLLTAVWHAGINPLPEGLATHARLPERMPGLAPATWHAVTERAAAVGYANAFLAVPRTLPWRPLLAAEVTLADQPAAIVPRLNPRPTAPGYQTAIVVGAQGETQPQGARELHCDALGRIRVRFHWQGARDGSDAAGASCIAGDSCWLRVAQRYAGPGVGTQFLPRIGQEVLIAFLDGDIDRPVVVGALYNGRGDDAQGNHAGGAAPAWHGARAADDRNAAAMLGVKSKEFGGSGHNRLVFDDSDGQLRLQLATTHAATELNLGYLIRQDDNRRGEARGEGFELRTDQWGAVRAERGLWISAYGAPATGTGVGRAAGGSEEAPAGEHVAATALLKQATKLGETLSGIAGTHLTPRVAAHEGTSGPAQSALIADQAPLKALLTSASTVVGGEAWDAAAADASERQPGSGTGRVPHTGDALLGLSAPAGIGLVAGQSLQWSMGETLTLASGGASNVATAGDLRVHAGQALGWLAGAVEDASEEAVAFSLVTAEGKLEFEAQHDQLKLQSRDGLKLVSANGEVELAAGKAVHLATSGGASVTIEGGNITVACPGSITVHAGKKSFVGGSSLERELVQFQEVCLDCLAKAALSGTPVVPL
ncbi:type VI secretion system Vgr family protein [Aerolutibacter ruishenii]|uniref:Rhs element Vgr protein n=1 Tax=Aerolutibacter ruishenii TaxID=686800 RepID=A0A562M0H6_9GAMM|nr:type VI secretion system Vgr family protein [Lysobacter ruishenii]TWI13380.1 Rhs element Vgr protein [Lysobacter ruishenii]